MRFKEFKPLREFAQQSTDTSNSAADLAYLIANTNLSTDLMKLIISTVDKLSKEEPPSNITSTQPAAPVTQQPAAPVTQQPIPPAQKTVQQQPLSQQDYNDEDDTLKEATPAEKKAEIDAYLNAQAQAGTGDKALDQLLYQVRDLQFKKMASEIVKLKFKDKNRESYELIKSKVRSLATRIPIDIMTEFLNDCLSGGIIDTVGMITGDTESTQIPLTDPKYEKLAKEFLDLNLERLGRGEIGLAFMGIEAVKEKTDLSVAGAHIEVKASRGTDFFMKGNPDEGGFGNHGKAVATFANELNKVGGQFKSTNLAKQGGIAAVGRTNIKNFNNYFLKLGQEKTIQVLVKVLKQFNKSLPKLVDQYIDDIANTVDQDGSVDYDALSLVTAKINFDYYKAMANHEGILVLNLQSFQYLYISDAETWASYVETNVLQQMYALDFRSNGLGGIAYTMNAIQ